MPILDGCCCFEQLSTGSKASAVYSFLSGVANIIIDLYAIVSLYWMRQELEANEREIWIPAGITVLMCFELAFNIIRLPLSLCLYVGVNQGYEGKNLIKAWKWGMGIFRVYQLFLMIYVLVWIGGHRMTDVIYVFPEAIVIAVYWLVETIVFISAMLCVVSYWEELMEEIFGKERRVRYFTKLANIRQAARNRLGMNTSRSYYGSRATLGGSQYSLARSQQSIPSKA